MICGFFIYKNMEYSITDYENKPAWIYELLHPISKKVRYVGCTTNPKQREQNHCKNNNPKCNPQLKKWILSLRKRNLTPIFKIIRETTILHARIYEYKRIIFQAKKGAKLLNKYGITHYWVYTSPRSI